MTDWIKAIFSVAPTVATALGTPLAGAAISAIGNVLGMSEPTSDKIAKAFAEGQIKPEDMVKIKQLEIEFKTHESEMGLKYAELAVKQDEVIAGDRKDARAMQVATHSKMPALLTGFVTLGFFVILGYMLTHPEFKSNDIMVYMIGQIATVWSACVAFYVSTTYNSANKNKMLAEMAPAR